VIHDLKIDEKTYIEIYFLGNATMNKIMGVSTINKDYAFPILNVANDIEGLGSRETSEGVQ
jgi:hypothetical protein